MAEDRLSLRPNGDVVLRLKTKYSDGTSHLLFSGLEFVEKLAALVPQPRIHLTRFFGCLAPHAKIRSQIVPKKEQIPQAAALAASADPPAEGNKRSRRMGWAELLSRVFAIEMKQCPHCLGELKLISAIVEPGAIRKILRHLDLPDKPPEIVPARISPQMSFA